MRDSRRDKTGSRETATGGKKPYTRPRLNVYGGVEEITRRLRLTGAKGPLASGIT
jgi:hypothetical protein